MRKIKIAQIGVNRYSHAVDIWNTMKRQPELFELAGYALVEGEREHFPDLLGVFDGAREMTLEQILDDPEIEAVTVETEEIHLTKYALLAAQKKKHMHMEKPGGADLAQFEQLIETVKQNRTVFHTGYMYRYNPFVTELMEKIKKGELGEIFSVEAQMNCRHPAEFQQWMDTFKGGMMFFLGCHLIDLILQIQGMPDKILPLNRTVGTHGVTSENFGMAVLEYPHGLSFAKTCDYEIGGFERRQLVVCGSKGSVEIKPLEAPDEDGKMHTEKREYTGDARPWSVPDEKIRSRFFGRYDDMMTSFAAMVRGEKENPYTYDYELALYRTILKCCGVTTE